MSKGLFARIAAIVAGLALPLSLAAPASAAVEESRNLDEVWSTLELDANELKERFSQVDVDLVHELDAKLTELRSHGLGVRDLRALTEGKTIAGAEPAILGGLIQTILDLVFGLLESLGLSDLLPIGDLPLPGLPVPGLPVPGLPGSEGSESEAPEDSGSEESESPLPLPELPVLKPQQASSLVGLLDEGGLVDQLLATTQATLGGLGLMDVAELPELPNAELPELPETGLPDAGALSTILNSLLQVVLDLLNSLGVIGLPELPEVPEVPDTPDVPDTPQVPDTPEVPEPETPEVPEPETPEVPEPETPEVPEPDAPEAPEDTEEAPEAPEGSEDTEEEAPVDAMR